MVKVDWNTEYDSHAGSMTWIKVNPQGHSIQAMNRNRYERE